MPIKYVGRRTDFRGKSLWEYLYNLKNFGVGRIAVRSMYDRYPEPCYYKIVKVETDTMDPEFKKGKIWVEEVFRGKKYPVLEALRSVYKSDFRLLRKDEEKLYTERTFTPLPTVIMPKFNPFPPLLKEIILRNMRNRGETPKQEPMLKMVYSSGTRNRARVVEDEDGETALPEQKHLIWKLYEDVLDPPPSK